ncbi:MAG TPA: helix-turn-helix domain-containing protein [Pseudonocardiaceae bacterium]|nr:helix-turn-helix domain-containing protein [Pseudonocardiaceae bacterium]
MVLPRDYAGQVCSLAKALEVVGERWTLLIVRDAFFGVRRFGDFVTHLGLPRAVLTERLGVLVAAGVLAKVPGQGRRSEYELTDVGVSLWPVVRSLMTWGDDHYAPDGVRREFWHSSDGGALDGDGRCANCGAVVGVRDTVVAPGPGLGPPSDVADPVTVALTRPHRLLRPLPR